MVNNNHITVIIPALNEEQAIAHVIPEIPQNVDQVIVVDNQSTDQTASRAEQLGAKVVFESKRGYGIACLTGIREAGETDIIAFVDGGHRDYPEDLVELLELIAFGQSDLAIGQRYQAQRQTDGRMRHQKLGTKLACWCIKHIYGVKFADLGPMRCLRKETFKRLQMTDENFGWTAEMQIKAFKQGMKITQVPVRYRERIGKSKISGTMRGSIFAGYKIFYWIFKLALPLRSSQTY